MIEPALFGAKVLFLVLLYFFIFRMVRSLSRDLSRGAEPISMAARPAGSIPEAPVVPVAPVAPEAQMDSLFPMPEEPVAAAAPVAPVMNPAEQTMSHPAPGTRGKKKRGRTPEAAPEQQADGREFEYLYNRIKPRLVVEHSKVIDDGTIFELKGGATIGRSPASQISLPDEYVSSTHARIFARKQFYFIEDIGSTNGTFVDGRRIEEEHQIKPGQEIVIGDTIFRYEE